MDEFVEQFLVESPRELSPNVGDRSDAGFGEESRRRRTIGGCFSRLPYIEGLGGHCGFCRDGVSGTRGRGFAGLGSERPIVAVSRCLIGDCLAFLNIVTQWLDVMERQGAAPKDAPAIAKDFIARIGHRDPAPELTAPQLARGGLSNAARQLLEVQLAILREQVGAPSGHTLSAGTVSANVLAACGRDADALNVRRLANEAASSGVTSSLVQALLDILRASELTAGSCEATESGERGLRVDVARVDDIVRLHRRTHCCEECHQQRRASAQLARRCLPEKSWPRFCGISTPLSTG